MAHKLFIGGLSFSTSNERLRELFAQVGSVESAAVVTDRETGRSRGFGFVEMATAEEAEAAVKKLNYAGEIVEESRETYTTIGRAIEEGSKRLAELNVVDNSVPFYPHRSTRHLRVP